MRCHGPGRLALTVLVAWPLAAAASPAMPTELLAAACNSCHGAEGRGSEAIPALSGGPALVRQLEAWRDQEGSPAGRGHLMQRVARGLTDGQIKALAEHYADEDREPLP